MINLLRQGIGAGGGVFSGACCVGFTPLLAGVSAVGAGFLINDAILFPLLALFLGLMLWGLSGARRRHGRAGPLYLGATGAAAAFIGPWVLLPLAYAGLAAIVASVAWDWVLLRRARGSCEAATG